MTPALTRYSVTTLEPGARLVLTHGWTARPRSAAFLARMPAPIITYGLDVLVQLVMAAITTEPCFSGGASGPCAGVESAAACFSSSRWTSGGGLAGTCVSWTFGGPFFFTIRL